MKIIRKKYDCIFNNTMLHNVEVFNNYTGLLISIEHLLQLINCLWICISFIFIRDTNKMYIYCYANYKTFYVKIV